MGRVEWRQHRSGLVDGQHDVRLAGIGEADPNIVADPRITRSGVGDPGIARSNRWAHRREHEERHENDKWGSIHTSDHIRKARDGGKDAAHRRVGLVSATCALRAWTGATFRDRQSSSQGAIADHLLFRRRACFLSFRSRFFVFSSFRAFAHSLTPGSVSAGKLRL